MAVIQQVNRLIEICHRHRIEHVILCPGSRNAALTIGFARHGGFKTYSISDERSAAFIALGLAQATKQTTAIVCTSGTATYNFAPAIAEAFFQEIPLLVLTADRPVEWIHQYDGQTIFQQNIFGKHVKKAYQLEVQSQSKDAVWYLERVMNEAITLTKSAPRAPVHINIPISEPFYPSSEEEFIFPEDVKIIEQIETIRNISPTTWNNLHEQIRNFDKVLIAIGQNDDENLSEILKLAKEKIIAIPVIADNISNIGSASIKAHDIFLPIIEENEKEQLQPELLITAGKSFISKNLKLFLRAYKPIVHWHVQENDDFIDPLQSLTHKIVMNEAHFFEKLLTDLEYLAEFREEQEEEKLAFFGQWNAIEEKFRAKSMKNIDNLPFSDVYCVEKVLSKLPENLIFHLGNSMSVRYANLMQFSTLENIRIYCNRGTSGIEGSLSTAVGFAMATDKLVVCMLGDVSFFYDRNALWNIYLPKNLRIIVLNNGGGNIFRMIDGPAKQPELKPFFETVQAISIKNTIDDIGYHYFSVHTNAELESVLHDFFKDDNFGKALEIFTNGEENQRIYQEFKTMLKSAT